MRDDFKIGIYLCTCEGEIETVIDLDSLSKEVSGWSGAVTVRKHSTLCSNGTHMIREDIKKLGLARVLIAGCSPFVKVREFTDLGINRYLVERVNLREQCSRAHGDNPGAAAKKAVALLGLSLEKARHSRPQRTARDFPVITAEKCNQCKRCVEECPSKAYCFDEKGFPTVDILKCRVCGICMGSCPLGAISLAELSIEQLSEMLDALDKTCLGDSEPVILGFLCRHGAYRAADETGPQGLRYPPNLLGIAVPCSGAVNGAIVAEAISKGVDGVLIAGCPDNHCRYLQGSMLAKARVMDISNKLREMHIEPERVRFVSITRDEAEKFSEAVQEYVAVLRKLGKNPLRIQ